MKNIKKAVYQKILINIAFGYSNSSASSLEFQISYVLNLASRLLLNY